jgi:hypothetical protein
MTRSRMDPVAARAATPTPPCPRLMTCSRRPAPSARAGEYGKAFTFAEGDGLPGRVHATGVSEVRARGADPAVKRSFLATEKKRRSQTKTAVSRGRRRIASRDDVPSRLLKRSTHLSSRGEESLSRFPVASKRNHPSPRCAQGRPRALHTRCERVPPPHSSRAGTNPPSRRHDVSGSTSRRSPTRRAFGAPRARSAAGCTRRSRCHSRSAGGGSCSRSTRARAPPRRTSERRRGAHIWIAPLHREA